MKDHENGVRHGCAVEIVDVMLPIYTIIDIIETMENVWSDSCVCAMVDRDIRKREEELG